MDPESAPPAPAAQETAAEWWFKNATMFHWCQDWWGGGEAESLCQILEAYAASRVQGLEERLARQHSALERILWNFKLLLASKPVKEASEAIAEADATLAEDSNGG